MSDETRPAVSKESPAQRLARLKYQSPGVLQETAASRSVKFDCRVREARMTLGLSQIDVAAALGLHQPTYWRIESGCGIGLERALRVAEFFGKPVEELWSIKRKEPEDGA